MTFKWDPGQGFDVVALARMQEHFPMPEKLAPQAWFMGEKIDYFPGLDAAVRSPSRESFKYLELFLQDVGGGIKAFKMRLPEWVDWFHYLLPCLVTRPDIDRLIGATVMYLMNLYPDGIPAVYPEFRDDVINTLGQA